MTKFTVVPLLILGLSFGASEAPEKKAARGGEGTQRSIDRNLEARRAELIALRHD